MVKNQKSEMYLSGEGILVDKFPTEGHHFFLIYFIKVHVHQKAKIKWKILLSCGIYSRLAGCLYMMICAVVVWFGLKLLFFAVICKLWLMMKNQFSFNYDRLLSFGLSAVN